MIRNPHKLAEWEKQHLRSSRLDFVKNLLLFEAMYEEGRALGVLPVRDRLEGIEAKIDFARKLNVPTVASKNRSGSK